MKIRSLIINILVIRMSVQIVLEIGGKRDSTETKMTIVIYYVKVSSFSMITRR